MIKQLCILFLCLLASSCTRHDDGYSGAGSPNSLSVRLVPTTSRSSAPLVENTVRDVTYFLFDADGQLEATQHHSNYPETNVVFEHLTNGKKTLVLIANTGESASRLPLDIPSGVNKQELDSLLVRMRPPYIFTDPESIPMFWQQEVRIPAENPVVEVALDRLFARLNLKNDAGERLFTIDSMVFENLTGSITLGGESKHIVSDKGVLRVASDAIVTASYILPCNTGQIRYSVHGKNSHGARQLVEGTVKPALKGNNSYTLSLSTGEIVEDGTPKGIKVSIDESVGSYSDADAAIMLLPDGGGFSISAESLDSLEVVCDASWVERSAITRSERFPSSFELRSVPYITADDMRETTIHLRNKYDAAKSHSIAVRQSGENRGAKYYVVVVAGQSNASGRDVTAYNAAYDAPSPRVFEFGKAGITPPYKKKYDSKSSTLSIVPLYYAAQNLDSHIMGRKSLHLPLAKEILKHIPNDYNVLVVSITYSGTGFTNTNDVLGVYDPKEMRPVNFPASLPSAYRFKARAGVLYPMLVDRVKYALGLNKRNKFLGVVWLQGESDTGLSTTDPYLAYNMFEEFVQGFSDDINGSIASEQLALGTFSPDMWFNLDHTPSRRNWQVTTGNPLEYARSHYYGGYKSWNPSTFIRLPGNTGMNPGDVIHFGQNAFRITIAPLTIRCMIDNGIFGGKPDTKHKFTRQISAAEIISQQGSIGDEDIQNRLVAWFPFSDPAHIGRNLSRQKDAVTIVNHGLTVADAAGLIGPDKEPRNGKALVLTPHAGHYLEINSALPNTPAGWSASLMLRRFNGRNNLKDQYLLLVPGTKRGLSYHRYLKESEGGYLTLSFQPAATAYNRPYSVTERLIDASYLRSNEEWVHLAYTFDNASRSCKVYMNGELTMSYTMPAGSVGNLSKLVLNDAANGVDAQIRDLCIWDRAISAETVFKVYLMTYYGMDADIGIDGGIGDWEDGEEIK